MKTKNLLIIGCLALSTIGFSQLDSFEVVLAPRFSRPADDGWMHFNVPNNIAPGACFQHYKAEKGDLDNDMALMNVHTDSLTHYTHYKYQQTYKGVPVEGAGCIEHFDSKGNLIFTNAKHAINIRANTVPLYDESNVVNHLLSLLPTNNVYAWQDSLWELQRRIDLADSNATWFPKPTLMLAVDEVKDMHGDIDGGRYKLVYKIPVIILSPIYISKIFYVDAITGQLFKENETHIDLTGDVYGYGNRNLDGKWRGGFINKWELDAEDNTHNIHTKKYTTWEEPWDEMPDTRKNDINWGDTYLTETSTHYHVTNTWDYYRNTFGRMGMDGNGSEIRVKTQFTGYANISQDNAFYDRLKVPRELVFGKTYDDWDFGMEPSIVAHEFTHGITDYTANLAYEFESGALNESFSDIFGVVIQAQTLDWGATDWFIGNYIPLPIDLTRSLGNPASRGINWNGTFDTNNNPVYELGQPRVYQGSRWCACPIEVDKGGVHINSGVQNNWFYALTSGISSQNITGIGMTKATQITYLALTSNLMSSSQFYDSKNATIQAAIQLFGECSQEHRSTVDAWNYVGISASHNCGSLTIENIVNGNDIAVYPNPANSFIKIELPKLTENTIQILDMNGKVVDEFYTNELFLQADISNLENGAYMLRFNFDGLLIMKKVIIQK